MDEKEYSRKYKDFMIKKSTFVSLVMSEWESYVDRKAHLLEEALYEEDQYLARSAINFVQFENIVIN